MATNLALDPDLLDRVVAVSGESTKKAAVTLALKEFVAKREQRRISDLFGKLSGTPRTTTRRSVPGRDASCRHQRLVIGIST